MSPNLMTSLLSVLITFFIIGATLFLYASMSIFPVWNARQIQADDSGLGIDQMPKWKFTSMKSNQPVCKEVKVNEAVFLNQRPASNRRYLVGKENHVDNPVFKTNIVRTLQVLDTVLPSDKAIRYLQAHPELKCNSFINELTNLVKAVINCKDDQLKEGQVDDRFKNDLDLFFTSVGKTCTPIMDDWQIIEKTKNDLLCII